MTTKIIQRILPTAVATTIVASTSFIAAQELDRNPPTMTIYQGNIALIQESRPVELSAAEPQLFLPNIAPQANTASLMLALEPESPEVKAPIVLAKKLNRNILSPQTLINDYVGKEVNIISEQAGKTETESAKILSNNGGLILQYSDRIELNLPENARIAFKELPEGLNNTPVLSVEFIDLPETKTPYQAHLAYLTNGLNWNTDYIIKLDDTQKRLTLEAWATINNNSGIDYEDTEIRLVAGTPNLVTSNPMPRYDFALAAMAKAEMMESDNIPAQSAGDYYLYTIPALSTLKNNEETQLTLFSSDAVPYEKHYTFVNTQLPSRDPLKVSRSQAMVQIQFKNDEASHLGFPLPAGTVRLYDAQFGHTLFVGEDQLRNSAAQQSITLNSGEAFDVTQERQSSDYRVINEDEWEMSYQLTITNAKPEPVQVTLHEMIPANNELNWEITATNYKATTTNSDGIIWNLTIPANGEQRLTYTIRYTHFKAPSH